MKIFYLFLIFCFYSNLSLIATEKTDIKVDSLYYILDTAKDPNIKAKALKGIGKYYRLSENYQKALDCYKELIKIGRSYKKTDIESDGYNNTGVIYEKLGVYDISLSNYYQALKLFEKQNDSLSIIYALGNISNIHRELKKYDKSLEDNFKALAISKKLNQHGLTSFLHSNIAILKSILKERNLELYHYQKALYYNSLITDSFGMAAIYTNIGVYYKSINKNDSALFFVNKALDIFTKCDYEEGIEEIYGNLGIIYSRLNMPDKAEYFLLKSMQQAKDKNIQKHLCKIYSDLSEFYYQQKKFPKSCDYLKKSKLLNDSIWNDEFANKMVKLQIGYETEKKTQRIQLLETKHFLQKEELRVKNQFLYSLTAGIVLLGVFLGVFYYQNKKQKEANRLLVLKNVEIVESEKRSQLIIQELKKSFNLINSKESQNKEKYVGSMLSMEQKEKMIEDLLILLEEEKPFLETNFSINILAEKLNTNRSYISQIINEHFNKTFTTLINEFRIKEARKKLLEADIQKYTIESIALAVGFNSKSSFNRAFKNYTGITPSFFIETQKNLKYNSFN